MADIKAEGKKQIGALDGNVKIEQGNNYLTVYDEIEGVYQIVIGRLPDGTIGFVIAKTGEDVFADVFA